MAMSQKARTAMVVAGVRAWRHRMRELGCCIDCGEKAAVNEEGEPMSRCRKHLDKVARSTKKAHKRVKGRCWCGDKVGTGDLGKPVSQCPKHHAKALGRSRRYRGG